MTIVRNNESINKVEDDGRKDAQIGFADALRRVFPTTVASYSLESGVPFGWVAGDEVYGNDRKLRRWLERAGIPHVLAIRSNEQLWVWTDQGLCQVRADRLTSQVDELGWTRLSRVNYICRLASISFAGSPPWPGPVAGQRWSGSWGRQTPG